MTKIRPSQNLANEIFDQRKKPAIRYLSLSTYLSYCLPLTYLNHSQSPSFTHSNSSYSLPLLALCHSFTGSSLSLSHSPSQKPQFLSRIGDETVLHGRPVQFKCQLAQEYPGQSVQWLHDGHPLTIDRGFTSEGQTCVLKINDVHLEDEGVFTCVVRTPRGSSSCCAKLTVLGRWS